MKKTLFILIFAIAFFSVFVSCNNNTDVVTYKVTVMNGEDVYREKDVAEGDIYVLPAKPNNTRPFKGWKVGESTELMQPGEDLKITADTRITAEWITSCTVSFDLGFESQDKITDETVDYGTYATEPQSSLTTDRPGYAFDGWYLNEEKYVFGTTPVTEDITLKAHWTTSYCLVTLELDENTTLPTMKIPYGEKISSSSANPTKTGYTFTEWTRDGETFSPDTAITSNMTLKANWTINTYCVTFDPVYEDAPCISAQSVEYLSKATSVTNPKWPGHIFDGWKTKDGASFSFDDPIVANTELVAQWSEIKTNFTLYFPKDVNDVATISVTIGGKSLLFKYFKTADDYMRYRKHMYGGDDSALDYEIEEDGDYWKYTKEVTGLDYGTYNIVVTTSDADNNSVGDSYSDSLTLSSLTTDKEVKVDASKVVDLGVTITTTAESVGVDSSDSYVITGKAVLTYNSGVDVLYGSGEGEASTPYTAGDQIAVSDSTPLKLKVSSSSHWTKGEASTSNQISFTSVIGAKGPAGGTIFYDVGNGGTSYTYTNSSGTQVTYTWRYLEVSESDLADKYTFNGWGVYHKTYGKIGAGKANTELLRTTMSDYSGSAAEACVNYRGGGYPDWFLPSEHEILALYDAKSLVSGISESNYWTSTEIDNTQAELAYEADFAKTDRSKVEGINGKTAKYLVRPVRCF